MDSGAGKALKFMGNDLAQTGTKMVGGASRLMGGRSVAAIEQAGRQFERPFGSGMAAAMQDPAGAKTMGALYDRINHPGMMDTATRWASAAGRGFKTQNLQAMENMSPLQRKATEWGGKLLSPTNFGYSLTNPLSMANVGIGMSGHAGLNPMSHLPGIGQMYNSMPDPETMGQDGAAEGVGRALTQYQNMPFLQRAMTAVNPESMFSQLQQQNPQFAQKMLERGSYHPGTTGALGGLFDGRNAGTQQL